VLARRPRETACTAHSGSVTGTPYNC
jgi:hypothetical protein